MNENNENNNFNINGIQDGVDGRYIYILFRDTRNVNLPPENSEGINGIVNLTRIGNTNSGGDVLIELVYDESINRWFLFDLVRP